jgi:hypothetical protein
MDAAYLLPIWDKPMDAIDICLQGEISRRPPIEYILMHIYDEL